MKREKVFRYLDGIKTVEQLSPQYLTDMEKLGVPKTLAYAFLGVLFSDRVKYTAAGRDNGVISRVTKSDATAEFRVAQQLSEYFYFSELRRK